MRSTWSGQLGFGLVQFPVKLYKATENHDMGFNTFHGPKCMGRIGYVKTCAKCLKRVDDASIMRGLQVDEKRVITVSDNELESLAEEQGKLIEVLKFVDASEVDPIMYEGTYYVGAGGTPGAKVIPPSKPYALLAQAMVSSGLVALVRFAMRSKTRLGLLRVVEGVIYLHTLMWPDEVRATTEVPGLGGDFSASEMHAATTLVEAMVGKFDPTDEELVDVYQHRLHELVDAKVGNTPFVAAAPVELEADTEDVSDLLAKLEASIAAHPAGKKRTAKKTPARKAPAKKAPAKKAPARRRGAA